MGASLPAKDHANLTAAGRIVQIAVTARCCKVLPASADKLSCCTLSGGFRPIALMLNSILIVEDQRDLAELAALHLGEIARDVTVCGDA